KQLRVNLADLTNAFNTYVDDTQDEELNLEYEWEPILEEFEPYKFNFGYKNMYQDYSHRRMIDEYYDRIESWRLLDPKRYVDYKAYQNSDSNEHWNTARFNIGDRVQIHYFLDDSPG